MILMNDATEEKNECNLGFDFQHLCMFLIIYHMLCN